MDISSTAPSPEPRPLSRHRGTVWGPLRRRGPALASLALLSLAVTVPTGLTRWAPALAQPAPQATASRMNHDLWQYDLGAQPAVMDMDIDGHMRRVLLQGTKTGSVFMLDAATGMPLRVVEHVATAPGAAPGARIAAAQTPRAALPR